jgi:hypothetical protein
MSKGEQRRGKAISARMSAKLGVGPGARCYQPRLYCITQKEIDMANVDAVKHLPLRLGQRHSGANRAILSARCGLDRQARDCNPPRWSRNTLDGAPIAAVTLYLECDAIVAIHTQAHLKHPLAAHTRRQLL